MEFQDILDQARARGCLIDKFNISKKWTSFKWTGELKKKGSYRIFKSNLGVTFQFVHWTNPSDNFELFQPIGELTDSQLSEHREQFEVWRVSDDAEKTAAHEKIAVEALRVWEASVENPDHPYLKSKQLKSAHGTRVSPYGVLLIPAYDVDGKLWSYQSITVDGKKLNLPGGRLQGCFTPIGEINPTDPLFVCEGFATAATVYEVSGFSAVSTFGALFFDKAAEVLRAKYPGIELVFCGDRDAVGIAKSMKHARRGNGLALVPKFEEKHEHPDYTDWNDLRKVEGDGAVMAQILPFRKNATNEFNYKQKWIEAYWRKHQIQFDRGGVQFLGSSMKIVDLQARLFLEAQSDGVSLDERLIKSFVINWLRVERERIWDNVVSTISPYNPDSAACVESFLIALCGPVSPEQVSVFQHFIWQVKRKAIGLPVEHHMMPVIIGESGGGKSVAIEKLLGPVSPLWAQKDLSAASDEREFHNFNENLVINMDEMANADRTQLDSLKRTITSDRLNYRILGKNFSENIPNRSTFIGTSNKELQSIIKDPTSVRRFYAIRALPKLELESNWNFINSVPYVDLWQGVDAKAPSPLLGHIKDVQKSQEKMKYKSDVDLWLEEVGLEPYENGFIRNAEIYKSYRNFCEANGHKFIRSMDSVGIFLAAKGFKNEKYAGERGKKAVYVDIKS